MFLSLICLVVCTFIGTVIKSAELASIRNQIEIISNISIKSSFSEYNKYLFDKYNLLFVDTSYKGVCDGGKASFSRHVSQYVDTNMDINGEKQTGFEFVSVEVENDTYATDNDYEMLFEQIKEYVINTKGLSQQCTDEALVDIYIETKINNAQFLERYYELYEEELYAVVLEKTDYFESFIEEKELPNFENEYTDIRDIPLVVSEINLENIISYLQYDNKKNVFLDLLCKDMKENYNANFDLNNHLCAAKVTIFIETAQGKVYECSREIDLSE